MELDAALLAAYRAHAELCRTHPIARGRISRPGIPAVLSESLAAAAAPFFLPAGAVPTFGGSDADLAFELPKGERMLVEVKASGASAFQEIKDRDLIRDALVWIDFGRRYVNGDGPIVVYFLPDPSRYQPPRRKLTLDLFLSGVSGLPGFSSTTFGSPGDLPNARTSPEQRA
jgi:hypothetical protein